MPKDFDIQPGGGMPWEFEKKGYQQRNLENLVSILGNKEVTKTLTTVAEVEKETWQDIRFTVNDLKGLVSGSNVGILSGISDSLQDTLRIELERAIAPLKNEIIAGINAAIEPLMPYISQVVNTAAQGISLGFEGWVALFTGRWDAFEKKIEELFPGITEFREDFRTELTEWWVRLTMQLDPAYRERILEANEQGTAGGVYSGQFDLDYDALEALLNNYDLTDYTEEE